MLYGALLALQFGLQPLLFRRFVPARLSRFSLIVATEVFKIVIAAVSFVALPQKELRRMWSNWSVTQSLRAVAPPAVIYAVQNLLIQASFKHGINPMLFNLLNQTKTLSAAFWIYVIIGKGQSTIQIFALLLLLASAVILNLDSMSVVSTSPEESSLEQTAGDDSSLLYSVYAALFSSNNVAVVCVVAASMLSGLSAALTQMILSKESNSLLVSAQLAVYGLIFLMAKEIAWENCDKALLSSVALVLDDLASGWDRWALLPVLSSAAGGILIGLVMQNAGSIMKGFALIFGLLFTGLAQWVVDGEGLTVNHWVALLLVSLSIYLHTSFPPSPKKEEKDKTS